MMIYYNSFILESMVCTYTVDRGVAPTLESVFDLLRPHSARWNDLARALRIPYNDRQIVYNERISADERLERIIYLWIQSMCSPVTWDHLIDVLKIIGLQVKVINYIEQQYNHNNVFVRSTSYN